MGKKSKTKKSKKCRFKFVGRNHSGTHLIWECKNKKHDHGVSRWVDLFYAGMVSSAEPHECDGGWVRVQTTREVIPCPKCNSGGERSLW